MPTFVAIDPRLDGPGQEGKVLLVMAETDSTGAINIVGVKSFQLPEGDGTLSGAPSEIAAGTELGTAEGGVFSAELGAEIPNLRDLEIESTLSLVSTRPVLYENLVLPFSDQKKIDQVIRFEVQDRLPFDLDSFLIDSMVLKKVDEKHYEILASLVPSLDVSTTLIRLKRLGADPKILSTRSSAVAALPQLFPELLAGNFALVIVTADRQPDEDLTRIFASTRCTLDRYPLRYLPGDSLLNCQSRKGNKSTYQPLLPQWPQRFDRSFFTRAGPLD